MTRILKSLSLLVVLSVAACSNNAGDGDGGGGGGDMAVGGGDGGGGDDMTMGGGGDMTGQTAGSVTGMVVGNTFGTAQQAWYIGLPDTAGGAGGNPALATTVVVYIFNKPQTCHDAAAMFGAANWFARIADKTQYIELKMYGPTTPAQPAIAPGMFTITTSATPAPGQANTNHELTTFGSMNTVETIGASGSITVSSIVDKASVAGSFDIHFAGTDRLMGTFNAGYCDIGVEP